MKGVYLIGYIETKEGRLLESPSSIKSAVLSICNSIGLNIVGSKYINLLEREFKGSAKDVKKVEYR